MKTRYLLCLILLSATLLFTCFAHAEEPKDDWYPFVIPEKLDPNSPANIGKLVLDPPAGKHGFVKVKDGHFYFEDGTRARFWGTNLCFNACFPTKEQAVILADRLAFFGFNAVRLHHMDYYFEPKGIFEDTDPAAKDPHMKKTAKLSENQLDRLDHLIYQLKQQGIYVDVNLLVRRHFTKADGVIDADKLEGGAKAVSMFDPTLIELQKQYARDMLTHYNPYTKLRYCDDPAIALIEITNENSLIAFWKQDKLNTWSPYSYAETIPTYYIKELDRLWGKNTHRPLYKALKLYPKETQDEIAKFYMGLEKKYFDGMVKFLHNECGIKIPVTGIGGYQTAEDIDAQANCDFIDKHAYWDHPRFPRKPWDKNDFTMHDKSILLDKNLGLIKKIKKAKPKNNKPYTITEWNHCYPNQYAYETPVLLAFEAIKNDWDALFQFTFAIDNHFDEKRNDIYDWFHIISNPQQLLLCGLGSLVFHETTQEESKITIKDGIFQIDSANIIGAAGFIKNKTFAMKGLTIRSKQDGAVFLYSGEKSLLGQHGGLTLFTTGQVTNNRSKRDFFGRFDWGVGPAFLKHIEINILICSALKIKVRGLDETGIPKKTIQVFYNGGISSFSTKAVNLPWFEVVFQKKYSELIL